MGTKNEPGAFDCYEAAEPDEPMFILLARDRLASSVVKLWAAGRVSQGLNTVDDPQIAEALDCVDAMEKWYEEHRSNDGQLS